MRRDLRYQDIAERFDVSVDVVQQNVREARWPHLRIGPKTIRFTEAQAKEIEKLLTVKPVPDAHRQRRHKRDRARLDDKVRLLLDRGEMSA